MDWYVDTVHTEKILREFAEAKNPQEAQRLIEQHFPGWLVSSLDKYGSDYSYLQRNWEVICQRINTTPKKIVLVADIKFDDEHKGVNAVAEFMTRNGYCVRRISEFQACPNCHGAIPVIEVWHLMQEKGLPVPRVWSNRCRDCQRAKLT